MKVIVVVGQSGAGISSALGALEDLGYQTVNRLPAALLPALVECGGDKVALSIPVCSADSAAEILYTVQQLRAAQAACQLVYLEAEEQTLINRYKFTRRPHPLSRSGVTTVQAIRQERDLLGRLRAGADVVVDTSRMSARQLRETMIRVATGTQDHMLAVSVISFGFKYGIPADADLVFDVRFLPNPYYVPELREKNGTQPPVRDYVFHDGTAEEYMEKLCDLADFLIPQYQREGKAVLTIAVGCTGGRHRSVAIAQALYEHFQENEVLSAVIHRDWQKG